MNDTVTLPEIRTTRLFARQLLESDIPGMHLLHRNPAVMKYSHKPEETPDETRSTFDRVMNYHQNHREFGMWSVVLKNDT